MDWKQYVLQGTAILFLGLGTYFDVKSKELPLMFLSVFCALGIFFNIIWKYQKMEMIFGGVFLAGMFLLIGKFSKEAIGYGDGLSVLVLGILKGWKETMELFFLALLISSLYGIWKMLRYGAKTKDTMPFLPFLFLAQMGAIVL